MKDAADNLTAELFPAPKKRGRPTTGKAMTPAQRKAAQRARDSANLDLMAEAPHKVPTRMLSKIIDRPEHYGTHTAFIAWLEIGERQGWISPHDRRQMLTARMLTA